MRGHDERVILILAPGTEREPYGVPPLGGFHAPTG